MICKDCRPVYRNYHPSRPAAELIREGVELCPVHEGTVVEGALLAIAEEDKAERRRYALLQAAATIVKGLTFTQIEGRDVRRAADDAELLLAEIEKREKEPQS